MHETGTPRTRWIWAAILGIVLACISVVAVNTGLLKGVKEELPCL